MQNNSLESIAKILKEEDNILIFPHVNIDGDALGSAGALCLALRELGKTAYVFLSEEIPANLDFLERGCCIYDDSILDEVGVSMVIDCNGYDRIKGREKVFDRGIIKGCVDHHGVGASEMKFDFYHCEPDSAATGELAYLLIKELGVEISLEIASSIFAAITTDTGNFQHSNTTKRTHQIVAELYDVEGFSSKPISSLIYDRKSKAEFNLETMVLSNLEFYDDGRIAVGFVSQEILDKTGTKLNMADAIIQKVMSLKGVEVGAVIKENADGIYKASLRAKSYANVSSVAAKFKGGGHLRAAGCTLGNNLDNKTALIEELTKAVNK